MACDRARASASTCTRSAVQDKASTTYMADCVIKELAYYPGRVDTARPQQHDVVDHAADAQRCVHQEGYSRMHTYARTHHRTRVPVYAESRKSLENHDNNLVTMQSLAHWGLAGRSLALVAGKASHLPVGRRWTVRARTKESA